MNEIELFLMQLPCLKQLEMNAKVQEDIADGNRWQTVTSSLIVFQFIFYVFLPNINDVHASFRSPYWLKKKRWIVAYYKYCLFTTPYFAPVHMHSSDLLCFDPAIVLDRIETLTITTDILISQYRLTHVKALVLNNVTELKYLENVIDLTQVQQLVVRNLDELLIFAPLIAKMLQLNEITVEKRMTAYMMRRMRSYRFEQILRLRIRTCVEHDDYIFDVLFNLFPCIQYLTDDACHYSAETMIRNIYGFRHLTNASFHRSGPLLNFKSSLMQYRRKDKLICRIYRSDESKVLYNWWIDRDVSDLSFEKLLLIFSYI